MPEGGNDKGSAEMSVAKSFNPNTPSPSIPANLMPPPQPKPSPRGEAAAAAKNPGKRGQGRPRKNTEEDGSEAAGDDPFAEFADGDERLDGRTKAGKRQKAAAADDASPKDAASAAAAAKGVNPKKSKKKKKGPGDSSSSEEELNEGEEEIEVRALHPVCSLSPRSRCRTFGLIFGSNLSVSCLGLSDRGSRGGCACVG